MHSISCLLVALCLSASMIRAQDQPKFSPAQQEVLDAYKARVEAGEKRDYTTWSRLVADDCIYSTDDGELYTNVKAHTLERWKLPHEYDNGVNPRDYVIHVYDKTAVMNFRLTVHEQFTDADIISEQRYTETYIKQNGSWLLIAKQWGNLPVNFHKPVAVNGSLYKDYVGEYQWRPFGVVETVSLRSGKLWSQFGKDEDEYLAPRAGTIPHHAQRRDQVPDRLGVAVTTGNKRLQPLSVQILDGAAAQLRQQPSPQLTAGRALRAAFMLRQDRRVHLAPKKAKEMKSEYAYRWCYWTVTGKGDRISFGQFALFLSESDLQQMLTEARSKGWSI